MAITKMKKFTLLTFHEYKDALLKDLQKFGDIHFKNLQKSTLGEQYDFLTGDAAPDRILRCEAALGKVDFALGKLMPHAPKTKLTDKRPTLSQQEFDAYLEQYDYEAVCAAVKELDDKISAALAEAARLKTENDSLRLWLGLDVAPADMEGLTNAGYLVGTISKAAAEFFHSELEAAFPCAHLEFLGHIKEDAALLLFVPAEQLEEIFAWARDRAFARANLGFTGIPSKLIAANEQRMGELEQLRQEIAQEIEQCGGETSALKIVRDYLRTQLMREKAVENFMKTGEVTLAEGWVPVNMTAEFEAILQRICADNYYLEQEDVDFDDAEVPIKLKNNRIVQAFENITSMYSMPRYNEFDPTPILTPFYWLFFGLMTGDIGYGILILIATAVVLKLVDLQPGMKNFIKFFHILSYAVILGGLIYGGAFGVTVFTPIPDGAGGFKAILDTNHDIVTMIVASVALGVIHVIVGVLVKGAVLIHQKKYLDAVFDSLFWAVAVLSGIGLILGLAGIIGPSPAGVCKWLFGGSLVGLALTQGRSSPSIGGKLGNGLYGVYGISGYVGDLVSYTRIVALALSGAYIAYSFNLMAGLLPSNVVTYVFKAAIAVFGHALNIGLALLGAYVHTCRLQYVEFFGKYYEGGGVVYTPLKNQNEYAHIKDSTNHTN